MRIRWTAGLRFLHPLLSELRGHGKGSRAGNGKPGASEVVAGLENPSCIRRRRDAERNKSSEAAAPSCREKPLSCSKGPYRKPTQVDEERILRPAGEVLLGTRQMMTRNLEKECASSRRKWPNRLFSKNTGLCETGR